METDIWGQLALEASQVYLTDGVKRSPFADTVCIYSSNKIAFIAPRSIYKKIFFWAKMRAGTHITLKFIFFFYPRLQTIEKLPDKVLLNIFSYLSHLEICRMAKICRRWRQEAYDTRLWRNVSLRPDVSGLHVTSLDSLLSLIAVRFAASLRYIELPIELITHTVLHELAAKCPNLTHMLLDFSTAMQLHDFSEMQAFPTKLRYLCICLSEVIFMEGFMRKIYNFINGLEVLHLIGTYEKVDNEEEEEIYEVINVHKLKSATPNLRVINLYGINFIDDSHIDAFSSNCIQVRIFLLNSNDRGYNFLQILNKCLLFIYFVARMFGCKFLQ